MFYIVKSKHMNYLETLKRLHPLMGNARIVKINDELYFMIGGECFSGSMKGISAYGSLLKTFEDLNNKDEVTSIGNKTLIDASSGNFGRALAAIGEYLDIKTEVVVSTKATEVTRKMIEIHGATLTIGGDTTKECYDTVKKLVNSHPKKYILVGQLDNPGNPQGHYEITAPNIYSSIPNISNIYMAMGSGGGINGVARYIHDNDIDTKLFATIATPGDKIVGTFSNNVDYETPFIKEVRQNQWLTNEIEVNLQEAIDGMIELRKKYGLFLGLSSGGVYQAYKKNKALGTAPGTTLITSWDNGEKWVEKLPN
jgi:cysteine synthase